MQRLGMPVLVWLAMLAGAYGSNQVDEDRLTDRTHQMQRILGSGYLEHTMLLKRKMGAAKELKGQSYKPPVARPSLYSQGVRGDVAKQRRAAFTQPMGYKPPKVTQPYKQDNLPFSSPTQKRNALKAREEEAARKAARKAAREAAAR